MDQISLILIGFGLLTLISLILLIMWSIDKKEIDELKGKKTKGDNNETSV